MTSTTKSLNQPIISDLTAKIAQAAYLVVSTVLMLNLRESLDADTAGDKSDAAFAYGM